MTQKHVDLLLKAIAVPEHYSPYLCDRIRFITGDFNDYKKLLDRKLDCRLFNHGYDLCALIKTNINYEFSFDDTQYAEDGMTREEWVETILAPLALALPEEK